MKYNTIEEAIYAIKNKEIIIVLDNEERENEGDFICAGEYATPENINFMATYGKGLICLPISNEYAKKFDFNPMVSNNTDNHETAFTVSIDHVSTTTGISEFERSKTILKLFNKESVSSDFRRPGHIFPLVAKEGGVLKRNGHTEATIDLMKLSGLEEVGVCCEIMANDGSMMKKENLFELAKKHNLKIIHINQIEEYRRKNEINIENISIVNMPTKYGDFKLYSFVSKIDNKEHLALVKGNVENKENVLIRVHSECLTGDVFGSKRCDCGEQLDRALKTINDNESGILIYMRQEGRGIGLINKLKTYELQEKGYDTLEANNLLGFKGDLRNYNVSAQILKFLKVKSINIMTNSQDKMDQLKKYGINISKHISIEIEPNKDDINYLLTKQIKMGHLTKYKKEEGK